MHETLTVQSFAGLSALEQWAEQIDALNRASARPNPYLSSDYLHCLGQYNEDYPDSDDLRLYTVLKNQRLIGYLPLRRVEDRFGPLRGVRLCFLAPIAIEQLGMVSAPGDELSVARALVHHIRDHEPQIDMLELVGQRPDSILYQEMCRSGNARFRVRDFDEASYSEIPIVWPDLASYFRAFSSSWRNNVRRCTRLLLNAGTVEIVLTQGAQASSAWFDAYLELESRSWKAGTSAAIAHHERRVERYRRLMAGQAGFTPAFCGILLDGFLVAGTLNGSNNDAPAHALGVWGFEMTYDTSYADLGPGILLNLLLVHDAIQQQQKFANLLNGFADYKKRWKAEVVPVKRIQLIRRRSLHNLRGTLGDLRRKFARDASPAPGTQEKENTDSAKQTPARPDRSHAQALAMQALAYDGPGLQRLSQIRLQELMPFLAAQTK